MFEIRLAQLKNGYRYNSDTLFLYDFISTTKIFGRVLDVGCGCGVLGLLLGRDFAGLELFGLDIDEQNLKITDFNAEQNGIKIATIYQDFSSFMSEKGFDFIVSNPPFYDKNVIKSKNEHISNARYSSSLDLHSFLSQAKANLAPKGTLYFCYDARQIGKITTILRDLGLNLTKIKFIHPKPEKSSKVALFEVKKNSKSMCEILPPLFNFYGEDFSDEAKAIFKKANTKSEVYE